ncbi:MAG TPA: DUF397 domain-containing protein [Streptosporangiaceae bacterium]
MTQYLENDPSSDIATPADEIFLVWRKSTKSIGNGQCVEAAGLANGRLAVRDSKDKSGPALRFNESGWRTFIAEVKNGIYDIF